MFILCCVFSLGLNAQAREEKSITKSFPIGANGQLLITNKYGFIECNIWNKDSVKIQTDIIVNTRKNDDAQDLINSIRINYNQFVDLVEAETVFGDNRKSFLKSYLSKIDPFDNNKVDVNYTIWMPATIKLEINNKFGDVLLENSEGDIDVTLSYGDLRIDQHAGNATLDLKFGRLVGNTMNYIKVDLRNYDVKLNRVEELNLSSAGSEITINEVNYARIDLSRDELEIENIRIIKGKANLSDIELLKVFEEVDLNLKNSSFETDEFAQNIKRVEIKEESSQIDMNIRNLNIGLEAELEDAQLSVPKSVENVSKDVIDDKKEHRKVSLDYGSSGSKVPFVLHGVKGRITLID